MTKSDARRLPRARGSTEVPGQALGYSLQYTRLVHLLLEAPEGSYCSLEYLDDIAQQDAQGGVKLIQSKSALTANPVADRAKSLWKTLSNWVTCAQSGGCDPKRTVFEMYISRPVGGKLVEAFSLATTLEAAREAVLLARDELWGKSPSFKNRKTVSAEIATYVENVLGAEPDVIDEIVRNFHLTLGSGSPQTDIEVVLKSHPISHSKIRDIADHICGLVKRRVDELLEAGQPAVIARDEFHTWYGAYVRKIDRETVLLSRAKRPSEEESKGLLPRVFVQQLDIIGMKFEDKLEAVSDYLMAAADRTDWAATGEVDSTSFEDLDRSLQRNWKNKRITCEIDYSSKPKEEQGRALFAQCMQFDMSVQAMDPPGHFIPGCFHLLADDLLVGWHPDYSRHLATKKTA